MGRDFLLDDHFLRGQSTMHLLIAGSMAVVLAIALGELVRRLTDAYFSGSEKKINVFKRFLVATSGAVSYIIIVLISRFYGRAERPIDPDISNIILKGYLIEPSSWIALAWIIGFSAYLGFLISLTEFRYSYIRLFLAGVFLPAIVVALVPG